MIDNQLLSIDNGKDKVIEADASLVAKEYYTNYAKYVLEYRALPSVYDGLKPVQRRIIYIANQNAQKLMKTAKLAGQVIALHPHGTPSIEGAIYDMAFPLNPLPLFETKGNFGGPGTPGAAARYTECYLNEIARKNFCQFIEYADYEVGEIGELEPTNLPSLIPYALIRGSQGIAVGLSTNVMPLNLLDLIDYYIDYIKNDNNSRYLVKPDVGSVLLEMSNKEIKETVNNYSGRISACSVITQLSNTVFSIESVFNKSIDSVLKRLDNKYKWFIDDKVGFRDASTVNTKYVFEIYDTSITPEVFRKALEDATRYSSTYNRVLEENGTAVYSSLQYTVSKSLENLNKAIDKKLSTEESIIKKQLILYDVLNQCKKLHLFNDISQLSSNELVDKITKETSCTIEIAKDIVKKPISYLTTSHDNEYKDLQKQLDEIKNHNRKKYLLSLYREFKKLVIPIYNKKVHSISKDSLIKAPCIKVEDNNFYIKDNDGEPFDNIVYFVSDQGYVYKTSLNPMCSAKLDIVTEYGDNIISFVTDKYKYLTIETVSTDYPGWKGLLTIELSTITVPNKKILSLRDNETIVKIIGYNRNPGHTKTRLSKTDWVRC